MIGFLWQRAKDSYEETAELMGLAATIMFTVFFGFFFGFFSGLFLLAVVALMSWNIFLGFLILAIPIGLAYMSYATWRNLPSTKKEYERYLNEKNKERQEAVEKAKAEHPTAYPSIDS